LGGEFRLPIFGGVWVNYHKKIILLNLRSRNDDIVTEYIIGENPFSAKRDYRRHL